MTTIDPRDPVHYHFTDDRVTCGDCDRWAYHGDGIRHSSLCDVAPKETVTPRQPGESLAEIPADDRIVVSGSTYQHRDGIKFAGGKWDALRRVWIVSREAALSLRTREGLRFEAAGASGAVNREIVRAVNNGQGALVASDDEIVKLVDAGRISVSAAMNQDF